ncbi:MAG: efflux RND transporter periplasmic adaptor subunit, partial [Pseudomonadota bacterium]|nr:efflux RND transporter periplasmic adaptor subunit [Pseudomonadota bacterium]
ENLVIARNQAAYTRLLAPADGVIASRSAEAGQVVGAGQPVFTLAADGVREVVFAVPEGLADRIQAGRAVLVELWSQDGRRWPGTVREVSPSADSASRTYAARAAVDAPDDALGLGQSAKVYMASDQGQSLSVPLSALQRQGQATAVFVVDPKTSRLRLQPVEIGAYAKDHVPVRAGLAAGDWVVAAGGHLLQAGQQVRPVDRDNRPVRAGQ